jgi:hypothetical protein
MIEIIKLNSHDKWLRVDLKFMVEGSTYRIRKVDGEYWFEYIKPWNRIYKLAKIFNSLDDAKEFIYSADCP